MIQYLKDEEWRIVEEGFDPVHHRSSESIFSIGNGRFGQRACFEEKYSGKTLQGSYVAGVYYPDKTRVGWWKNGYPEYFAKVLNSTNWIGIDIEVDGEQIDLAKTPVKDFVRVLDMRRGILERSFTTTLKSGKTVKFEFSRFCSMDDDECAAISLNISSDSTIQLDLKPYLDANVRNQDSNYDEMFWEQLSTELDKEKASVVSRTRKTGFVVGVSMEISSTHGEVIKTSHKDGYAELQLIAELPSGEQLNFNKFVGVCSSLDYSDSEVGTASMKAADRIAQKGYEAAEKAHETRWEEIWEMGDILIDGDVSAQQGIRFNIFQLNQTYTGKDERLNIGPKGFTGEKYGGSTYWDTEAYCLPFYLSTHEQKVARQLLVYRYKHLTKAIENAAKLGFKDGAALYPMVTMNGEECHNEWEITFEEIHRNGAIAFAIYNYIRHTGDQDYLAEFGLDVLVGIARFWAQRVNFSNLKNAYVILGVTGPNEYENNVNNNWYTNYIASWCLKYAGEATEWVEKNHPESWSEKSSDLNLNKEEVSRWKEISSKMYFPKIEGKNIYLQQDGFIDKEQVTTSDLKQSERPINQHWSWDRILRSVFIKQADTLQGLYLFEEDFSEEVIRDNFDFYEPMTVHESSLSPCVHCVLAAKLGYEEKAYEMYLRTSRLDLDDYNHEAHEGLHITSMAGTWMSVVEGFGGMRVKNDVLSFNPMLPGKWKSFTFKVLRHNCQLIVQVDENGIEVRNLGAEDLKVQLYDQSFELLAQGAVRHPLQTSAVN